MNIDVIVLTKTADLHYYGLTQRTITTLTNRNKSLKPNLIVVESFQNATQHGMIYPNAKTILYKEKFNYNRALNMGLEYCKNEYILICNNDLLFLENSIENLIGFMQHKNIYSACPQEPFWHSRHFTQDELNQDSIMGYRIMHEMVGWCICTTRMALNKIGPFDEQFDYYYQDNDYAMALKHHGIEHHLVNNAKVRHEFSQSDGLIEVDKTKLTAELKEKFDKKWNQPE